MEQFTADLHCENNLWLLDHECCDSMNNKKKKNMETIAKYPRLIKLTQQMFFFFSPEKVFIVLRTVGRSTLFFWAGTESNYNSRILSLFFRVDAHFQHNRNQELCTMCSVRMVTKVSVTKQIEIHMTACMRWLTDERR